jgi:uncharacterized protein (DUF1697 family)
MMARHIALLRGINVGGHTVKMQELRRLFESLGFSDIETVIASGNVVFKAAERRARKLEQAIERHLAQELGYEVATFLRTIPELTKVTAQKHFDLAKEAPGAVVYVIFLRSGPAATVEQALRALDTDNDEARVGKREVYWLRRARGKDSEVFGAKLGKLLGAETTARNMNTVQRIVEKYR